MRGAVAFALLALLAQILIPPGYMPAAAAGRMALVICTGHGPMQMGPVKAPHPKSPDQSGDHVCAFAGHGASSGATPPPIRAPEPIALARPSPPAWRDLAPGRGLAAPPPPSQASPVPLA